MKSVPIDPTELTSLRMIAKAAAEFVDALDSDEKIKIVAGLVPRDWEALETTVIVFRETALPVARST